MKTILNASEEMQNTYTGKCLEWPDGLYQYGEFYIAVCGYDAMRWFEGLNQPQTIAHTTAEYDRIPGYTGRIAAITPEVEE